MKHLIKLLLLLMCANNILYAGRQIYPVNVTQMNFKTIAGGNCVLDLSHRQLPSLKGLQSEDVKPCSILNFSGNRIESIEPFEKLLDNAGPQVTCINLANNNLKVVTAGLLCQLHRVFPHLQTLNITRNRGVNEYPIKLFRKKYNHFTIQDDDSCNYTADSSSSSSSEESTEGAPLLTQQPNYGSSDESDVWSDDAANYHQEEMVFGNDSSGSSSGGYYDSGQGSAADDGTDDSDDIIW